MKHAKAIVGMVVSISILTSLVFYSLRTLRDDIDQKKIENSKHFKTVEHEDETE